MRQHDGRRQLATPASFLTGGGFWWPSDRVSIVLVSVPQAETLPCSVSNGPHPLPVVAAVIERGGQVLIAQRPAHKHLAMKWEFPGGKVDADETAESALIREIREELGCAVTVVRPLARFTHTYGRTTIEMIPFVCQLAEGSPEPHPLEHAALAWVPPRCLAEYDLAAADLPVVAAYGERSPA